MKQIFIFVIILLIMSGCAGMKYEPAVSCKIMKQELVNEYVNMAENLTPACMVHVELFSIQTARQFKASDACMKWNRYSNESYKKARKFIKSCPTESATYKDAIVAWVRENPDVRYREYQTHDKLIRIVESIFKGTSIKLNDFKTK